MRRLIIGLALVLASASSASAATFQSVGLYQSFDQMVAWANSVATANPSLVNEVQFGTTSQGRPLIALEITSNVTAGAAGKPQFLITAGMHAREVVGSQTAYKLAQSLIDGYNGGNAQIVDELSKRDVWIIPCMNPDGRVDVEAGFSQQRKNMQVIAGQSSIPGAYQLGVDLNRNFPHRWSDAAAAASAPEETYAGPTVLSTPEASSLWTLLHDKTKFPNLYAAIDYHSGAQTVLAPWTSPNDYAQHALPAADRTKLDAVAAQMASLASLSTARLGYESYGTLTDSLYEEFHTWAFTEEVYSGPSSDYFTLFNPLTQATIDATVAKADSSGLYFLSDSAFAVPEPASVMVLIVFAGLLGSRRARARRPQRSL